jgi:hypothetical protein
MGEREHRRLFRAEDPCMPFSLTRSLVKHALKHVGDLLGSGIVPIGSIAAGVFEDWADSEPHTPPSPSRSGKFRSQLQAVAGNATAYRHDVEAALEELAANHPEAERQSVRAYLAQVPGKLQASLRRKDDPTGRTVPPDLPLRRAEDLLPILPGRMPRFKSGDCPVPGTDLVVETLLGVGGFGEVWKAAHRGRPHAAPVALKFCTDEAAARTLRKEVDLLDRVSRQGRHEGIVELRYAHLEGDTPCLEYEYIDGGDLAGFAAELQAADRATPVRIAKLMSALAESVGFAHRLHPPIVHRDLKPANILTTRVEDKVVLKVADFGIGGIASEKAVKDWAVTSSGGTTFATGSCTPLYASPQQRKFGPPDPRDDVYALGVIWYQMLVGDLTAEPPRGGAWKKKILDRGASAEMVGLLERCIEDDRDERPADARLLAEELQRLAGRLASPPPMALPWVLPVEQRPAVAEGRVTGRVFLDGRWGNGILWFSVSLDGELLGECRLLKGCDLPFETTPGEHLLELKFGNTLTGYKTKTYRLSLLRPGNYRVALQYGYEYSFLGLTSAFGNAVDVFEVPRPARPRRA